MQEIATAKHIERWPLSRLVPYVRNPRTHSDARVAQIAGSIAEFGFTNPILVDTNAGINSGCNTWSALSPMPQFGNLGNNLCPRRLEKRAVERLPNGYAAPRTINRFRLGS